MVSVILIFFIHIFAVTSDGYVYEERSDSCIKITNQTVNYEEADNACTDERAYLAVLNSPELRITATKILKINKQNEAWINPPFKSYEKFAKNRGFLISVIFLNGKIIS